MEEIDVIQTYNLLNNFKLNSVFYIPFDLVKMETDYYNGVC